MRFHPVAQLTLVKLRELLREPEAWFWVFVFPLLLAVALGIAFRSSTDEAVRVGVVAGGEAGWIATALEQTDGFVVERLTADEADRRLRGGKLAIAVSGEGGAWTYAHDPSRPDGRAARRAVDDVLQRAAGRADVRPTADRELTETGSRYIDFLLPGLIGMNLMGTGMWAIGFSIVEARSKGLLRRLVATPMRRSDFLLSQLAGRLIFLALEVGVLVAFGRLAFDVPVRGSYGALAAVSLLGAVAFGGIGLAVAARPRTTEGVSGLMNFVMLPMWIGSGTFFSTSRFPEAMQPVLQALPLTAVNDALRAVMLEGQSLGAVGHEALLLAGWGAAGFAVALAGFRWS